LHIAFSSLSAFQEYTRVVNEFIDDFWDRAEITSKAQLTASVYHRVESWFTARMKQCAAREAFDMVRSARSITSRKKTAGRTTSVFVWLLGWLDGLFCNPLPFLLLASEASSKNFFETGNVKLGTNTTFKSHQCKKRLTLLYGQSMLVTWKKNFDKEVRYYESESLRAGGIHS
jgi:hypothetical protein